MAVALSVGQCGFDDSAISRQLRALGTAMDRAHTAEEAIQKLSQKTYHLVMVNRILDGDGSSGVEFIRECKNERAYSGTMLLISDYAQAQTQAIAAGAISGFGKSQLHDPDVLQRLQEVLGKNS